MTAAMSWITGPDTGTSSKAIWSHMMTGAIDSESRVWGCYPSDPADFGRCYRLLALVPEWRPRIAEMSKYGVEWAAYAPHWDELTALFEQHMVENGGCRGVMKKLYGRMHELVDGARICTECNKAVGSSWSTDARTLKMLCRECGDRSRAALMTTVRL